MFDEGTEVSLFFRSQFKSLHDEAKRHIAHVVGIEQVIEYN